ncbi:hypothetical protein [Rodentibacter caecimuris]|uniref:Uncharacterized protein n=1 Tax=Rodentibacter caecimuris TaxID=1796644 RepID=A0ABX3KWD1_9PAST|nr:hypothetical protein BKG89_08000 [Rodentibacter heylii]
MRDFIEFSAKLFFRTFILLGTLILLFVVDFSYILAFIGVFLMLFIGGVIIAWVQVQKHSNELKRIEQEKAKVKYVIIE